jgi:hypothetical protein
MNSSQHDATPTANVKEIAAGEDAGDVTAVAVKLYEELHPAAWSDRDDRQSAG